MKMFFTCCIAALCTGAVFGQSNNPYNQAGADFIRSTQIISAEIKNGNIKNADEATIKKIQALIPSKTQIDPALAGEVMKNVSQPNLPFSNVLKSSSLKPEVQREVSMMLEHSFAADVVKHKQWLKEKTEGLLRSSFDQRDKELLLTLVAIQYHQNETNEMGRIRCETSVDGRTVSEGEGMDCAGAATLIGFILGYTICGFHCGIGGAVVGFVAVVFGSVS